MIITAEQLRKIVGGKNRPGTQANIIRETSIAINEDGAKYGLDRLHVLAHFIAQIAHESASFKTTREYASGAAYEWRRDLGNTKKGDGKKFRGHGLIQCTGRANHREFTVWCRKKGYQCPDFEEEPEKAEEFPWAYLCAVWYWETRKLTAKAEGNDLLGITKSINGGTNGLGDRTHLYIRTALILLGYRMQKGAIAKFQRAVGLVADDVAGPKTRDAMHKALREPREGSMEREEDPPPEVVKPPEKPPVGARVGIGAAIAAAAAGIAAWFGWG